jgi:hypothetical protein
LSVRPRCVTQLVTHERLAVHEQHVRLDAREAVNQRVEGGPPVLIVVVCVGSSKRNSGVLLRPHMDAPVSSRRVLRDKSRGRKHDTQQGKEPDRAPMNNLSLESPLLDCRELRRTTPTYHSEFTKRS